MRNVVLASAAMLSVLLFATIAATTPGPRGANVGDPLLDGYGVYADHVVKHQ